MEIKGIVTEVSIPAGASKPVVPVQAEAKSVETEG